MVAAVSRIKDVETNPWRMPNPERLQPLGSLIDVKGVQGVRAKGNRREPQGLGPHPVMLVQKRFEALGFAKAWSPVAGTGGLWKLDPM